jgi:hypothetical protein
LYVIWPSRAVTLDARLYTILLGGKYH